MTVDIAAITRDWCELRPAGGFSVILCDPPWRFAGNSAAKPGRNAMRHYDCLTVKEMAAMPVADALAADDAVMLMWVTVPFAEQAFTLMRAWGFRYKSQLVWPKQRIGTGYWARNRHELVYIGRRGLFPCDAAMFPDSIIPGAQREHSRKPGWIHDMIDAAHPDARKIELFARAPRKGWCVWGNEAGKFNEEDAA